ncbi:MAG: hypothetical protein CVU22_21810 [Betaproteobacteria bacterium HGW-Betaproteobacteria-16]|nr:MAG: hypothetical protein CVU22_21810 [Betaproteobacteria bacterium HGW-Betaproteobacteria-16]
MGEAGDQVRRTALAGTGLSAGWVQCPFANYHTPPWVLGSWEIVQGVKGIGHARRPSGIAQHSPPIDGWAMIGRIECRYAQQAYF